MVSTVPRDPHLPSRAPSERVAVDVDTLPWLPLADGVDQRLLENVRTVAGGRQTRILRILPSKSVPWTAITGGVDVYVLEGTLVTDGGEQHPAGTYIALSRDDRPSWSAPGGAQIFVKNRPSGRRQRRRVATKTAPWRPAHSAGFWIMSLDEQPDGRVVLLRFEPGAHLSDHRHAGGEEFLVLAGTLRDDCGTYTEGWWVRQPPGSNHRVWVDDGCTLLTTAGHLLETSS